MLESEPELPFAKADEVPAMRCLPVMNLIWLCLLSIALLILWSTSVENGAFHPKEERRVADQVKYPFNVVLPREDPSRSRGHGHGFVMRVPSSGYLPVGELSTVTHYRVCCSTPDKGSFVCGPGKEGSRVGVDAVLQQERMSRRVYATVLLPRLDMVGAACVLTIQYY